MLVRDVLTTLLEVAGAALVVVGFALVWAPLGWIVAGVLLVGFAAAASRSGS